YLIPFLGFVMLKLNSILGLGMVIYTIILAMKRQQPSAPPPAPVVPPPPPPAAVPGAATEARVVPPPGSPLLAPLQYSTLPRAGFWIRLGAAVLDAILIAVVVSLINLEAFFLLAYAAYCV